MISFFSVQPLMSILLSLASVFSLPADTPLKRSGAIGSSLTSAAGAPSAPLAAVAAAPPSAPAAAGGVLFRGGTTPPLTKPGFRTTPGGMASVDLPLGATTRPFFAGGGPPSFAAGDGGGASPAFVAVSAASANQTSLTPGTRHFTCLFPSSFCKTSTRVPTAAVQGVSHTSELRPASLQAATTAAPSERTRIRPPTEMRLKSSSAFSGTSFGGSGSGGAAAAAGAGAEGVAGGAFSAAAPVDPEAPEELATGAGGGRRSTPASWSTFRSSPSEKWQPSSDSSSMSFMTAASETPLLRTQPLSVQIRANSAFHSSWEPSKPTHFANFIISPVFSAPSPSSSKSRKSFLFSSARGGRGGAASEGAAVALLPTAPASPPPPPPAGGPTFLISPINSSVEK
mmetsp:Transcript_117726/g.263195  ORF Transcript_117726/g.263195 Transcript_117726/m.263195 type:complete len:398 (+) Transcript_117726:658-1851(+)